ncbi:C-type lection lectoxin-Enh3-like [Patiria miniata]|uniref:C-type lectin domain-containing protein n=1 Tax=Patiria miniata TaxID=46514 RepID=A0A913ZWD8_PATMI|nr:C-type lection lectoxin-Enh3-like [Patiria miniata]
MKALLLTMVVATICQLAFAACPESDGDRPWRESGCSCYQVVLTPSTWTEARDHCAKMLPGAHLATLTSRSEISDLLWNVMGHDVDLSLCPSLFHWIGVTDIGHDDIFTQIDGATYENWVQPFEPHHKPDQDDCGAMHPHGGSWYGEPCSFQHCFVCEVGTI